MKYVVTIARTYGSGGKEIGKLLAKDLGIKYYGREIFEMSQGVESDLIPAMMKVFIMHLLKRLTNCLNNNQNNSRNCRERIVRYSRTMCRLCASGYG